MKESRSLTKNLFSSIYGHMIRGSLWAILMRSSLRIIGLVNTVILARLLTPEDFGIVAMASIVVGFLELFLDFGPYILLIREPEVTRARCNTAWTVRVLQGAFLAVVLVVLGPYAVEYFQEPRITQVLYWLAVAAFLGGFENVGVALFRKNLDFRSDFRFNIYARLLTFVIVVSLAVAMRTYWALVLGQVVGVVGRVLLSFWIHSFRPAPSLIEFNHYFRFSLSIVPLNVSWFLWRRADTLILGGTLQAAALGAYNMAAELSQMFTSQLRLQINRALLPSYSKLLADREELAKVFVQVQACTVLLIAPVGFGLSVVASDLVPVVFGTQWVSAIPLLQWTALYAVAREATNPLSGQILVVSGHERLSAVLTWAKLAVVLPAMLAAAWYGEAKQVPMFAAFVTAAFSPVQVYALRRVLPIGVASLIRSNGRPLLAAGVMALVVSTISWPQAMGQIGRLAASVAIGVGTYSVAVFLLWKLDGSPTGPESAVVDRVVALLRRERGP